MREWYGHAAGLLPLWVRLALPWSLVIAWFFRSAPGFAWVLPLLIGPISASLYAAGYMLARRLWRIPLRRLKMADTLLLTGAMIGYGVAAGAMAPSAMRPYLFLLAAWLMLVAWLQNWCHEALVAAHVGSSPMHPPFSVVPARGPITAGYRSYDRSHTGVDLGLPVGTPVLAPAPGRVAHAGPLEQWGYTVILDHGEGWSTLYAHLEREAVRTGTQVEAGCVVGWSGTSGISTGPHLHLELRYRGAAVDPSVLPTPH